MWKAGLTTDRTRIQGYLETDRRYAAYAIGDLEPRLFAKSTWAVAELEGRIGALVLHFRGLTPAPLQMMGDNDGLRVILSDVLRPERAYIVCLPEHVAVADELYDWESKGLMWRMALNQQDFRASRGDCVRLGAANVDHMTEMYSQGQVSSFDPEQLDHNVFYGVFDHRALVAAAGTQRVSRAYGVAAVASVYTRPEHRGGAYGATTTSAVVGELMRMGIRDIMLAVGQDNESAIRIYERLGFERYCPIVAGAAIRRH